MAVGMLLCLSMMTAVGLPRCEAVDSSQDFESSRTTWQVRIEDPLVQLQSHRRNFEVAHSGHGCEEFRISTTSNETQARLDHPVDRSLAHDELTGSVWVLADRPGVVLAMRVRLPNQIDPRTGRPLDVELRSAAYTQTDRWSQLTV
ncbi:MAG: hypothetical protein KF861_24890, partial [Planctomycetaceae bacterium]|nr:hypothetical protein [Planctomycetaceae bacterium]